MHLTRTLSSPKMELMSDKTIIFVGDVHFPFENSESLKLVLKAIKELEPYVVVQLGDIFDFFSFGRFAHTQNLYTPQQELLLGKQKADKFWESVRKLVPTAKLYQVRGNHCERPLKTVLRKAPELECFLDIERYFKFPGVHSQPSEADELVLRAFGRDICVMHGFLPRPGEHLRKNLVCTVTAHTHVGWVFPLRMRNEVIWELNCGWIGGPAEHPIPFGYTKQRQFARQTQGMGVLDKWGPRFVPFDTN